jgi:hypothetical protein
MGSALLFAAQILFVLFSAGMVGSFVVIVITFIEDLELFFDSNESKNEAG